MRSRPRSGVVETVARFSLRRRWLVIGLSLAALALLSAASGALGGEFRQSFALPGSETQEAADALSDGGFDGMGGHQGQLVVAAPDVLSPPVADTVEALLERVEALDGVTVLSPYAPSGAHQIADDASVAFAALDFGDVAFSDAAERAAEVRAIAERTELPPGTSLEFGGDAFVEESEFSSEGIGLVAALVILLLAFGSVLAAGLPIVTALVGIGCGMAVVTMATRIMDIPPFTPGVVAMIGIGAGIDYALFVVARYREELASGCDVDTAVLRAMRTAGRATVFAGATVVTSLLGLLVVGLDDVRSLALAAAAGVLFVMLASVTLLPALLGLVGRRIDRFGLPHRRRAAGRVEDSVWYRWSRLLQRRPLPVALAAIAVLVLLTAPAVSLRLGMTDASTRPEDDTTRRAHDLVAEAFGEGASAPLFVAVTGPAGTLDGPLSAIAEAAAGDPGVASVVPPQTGERGDTGVVIVTPATGLQDPATTALVHRLRDDATSVADSGPGGAAGSAAGSASPAGGSAGSETSAVRVLVGGPAAAVVDFADHNARTLPWFVGAVLLAAFLLLLVVFRSVLVPLKAVVVNLLSVGAAYGVVVAVFQWGWFGAPFGSGPIEAWVPMMLFAIVFGLSMDYEVFLLSRIRERYEATGDNAGAVADGIARTARLITAAAAIMVCVFAAFALSSERALQMMGVGLAVAIAVDATVVRLVLVPATMELLGDRNWWLPGWLAHRLPRFDVEARADEPAQPGDGRRVRTRPRA